MASDDAVGAVGRTLQAVLADRLEHPNGGDAPVPVTLGAPGPDRDPDGTAEPPRLNLYLYQVATNPYLANQDLPGMGHPSAYGHPPLSLDLRFLLTVFGSTANGEFFDETPSHLLLGSSMRVLHDHPVITEAVRSGREPSGVPLLDPSLRGEREQVKLTLWPLALEDLSNLWTALSLPYRLSVAYEVSVVQIESRRARRYPRPVGELPDAGPRTHVPTLRRPRLDSVTLRRADDPPDFERSMPLARIGDTLVLRGSSLAGEGLAVRLGNLELSPDEASAAGDRVTVTVPDDVLPDGSPIPPGDRLEPGVHPVAVVAAAASTLPQAAISSGQVAFTLVPTVTSVAVAERLLTVEGNRLLSGEQPAQLIVGDAVMSRPDYLSGSDATVVTARLPDTLPAWPAAALVSGDLSAFPELPPSFELQVTVGSAGPETATLPGLPTSLQEAAQLLEAAVRGAGTGDAFRSLRVAATDRELVVVPGGLEVPVVFSSAPPADALRLSASSGGAPRNVYLSGALRPFPFVTSAQPELDVTIGGSTERLQLGSTPTSISLAAERLDDAIRAVADPDFTETRVTVLGDQLCVVGPAGQDVAFAAASDRDETTAAELRLTAGYAVRVRVSGVESVDVHTVELPA